MSITDIVAITLSNNPLAAAAKDELEQAESTLRQAQAQRRLQLSFNSVVGASNADVLQPPPQHETFGAIQNSLTLPIPVGAKPNVAIEQAADQMKAAQAAYRSAQLTLAAKATAAYYDCLKNEALAAAAQQNSDTAERELSDAQKRHSAGDIPALDVFQAQVPAAADQAALLQSQTDESQSQEALNDLLGRPLDQPLSLVDVSSAPTMPNYSVEQARTMAVATSPDVAAADASVEAEDAALRLAKQYSAPTLSLQAIDLRSKDVTSFSREDTLQASVIVPIDDGGAGRASVAGASAALAQARQNAVSARRAAIVAVSASYLSVQSSLAQVTAAQEARDIAQKTFDLTGLGYQNGLYPLADTIAAENALAQSRLAYVQALYSAAAARSSLDAAVSGSFQDDRVSVTK